MTHRTIKLSNPSNDVVFTQADVQTAIKKTANILAARKGLPPPPSTT